MKKYLQIICGLILCCTMLLTGCGQSGGQSSDTAANSKAEAKGQLTISMLDIGQGDAVLIQTGVKNILIDTGDDKYYEDGKKGKENTQLLTELQKLKIDHIDTLVMTHAHADHIGKADKVIAQYGVKELVYNGIPSTSKYFINALKAAKANGTQQVKVKAGDVLDFGNGVSFEIVSPSQSLIDEDTAAIKAKKKVDVNNESVVGRLTFGNFAMLFTGDAEGLVEKDMVASYGKKLKCQVLKAGHHGSKTSSTAEFLKLVQPESVVMSLGVNNQYGHPHEALLNRLQKQGIKNIYRTDANGTITIVSDGSSYSITTEK
ncbi:MAG: ComEC/Rec2 family competence protein [Anaerovibrio sp.]|nr:ComEC/Rec2 family competence protein [Anaerovibrio sp.]